MSFPVLGEGAKGSTEAHGWARGTAASPEVGDGYLSSLGRLRRPQGTASEEDPSELSPSRLTDGSEQGTQTASPASWRSRTQDLIMSPQHLTLTSFL